MRPGIREQRLETVREAMAELRLQRLIAGVRAIAHHIKLAGEVGIRRIVKVLPHQLPARRAEVGDRDDIGLSQSLFHRCVPLIGSGQYVIRVYHGKIRNGWSRRKRRRRGMAALSGNEVLRIDLC